LIIALSFVLAFVVILSAFFVRSPVLIVTEFSFAELYGARRLRAETVLSSFVLFRRVKPIAVIDDAGDDIIQVAVEKAASKPLCVIFPLRFARVARSYREKNPEIPVVLLEGRFNEGENPSYFAIGGNTEDYFIYKTDISTDFYRAGLAAAILDGEKNERIAVFIESDIQSGANDALAKAFNDAKKPLQISFFSSFSQFSGSQNISCVISTGVGAEYMEKNAGIPVILFTWIAPELIPADAALIFNDSPWVQAVPAVRMVKAGMKKGEIPSKILFSNSLKADRSAYRKLRKIL